MTISPPAAANYRPGAGVVTDEMRAMFAPKPMPKQFFNTERLLRMMDAQGLDAIVSSYQLNVYYLSGFYGTQAMSEMDNLGVVIIPRKALEDSVLVLADTLLPSTHYRPTWINDLRTFAATYDLQVPIRNSWVRHLLPEPMRTTPAGLSLLAEYFPTREAAVLKALKDLGLEGKRVGFDNPLMQQAMAPHTNPVDVYRAMIWVRMVKTPAELDVIKTASKLNQLALETTLKQFHLGMTWRELAQTYDRIAYDLGGTVESPVSNAIFNAAPGDPMANDPLPIPWHTGLEGDYVLEEGSQIMFDCHGWYNKYCWDGGKTWIIGDEQTGEGKRIADACGEVVAAITENMKPGVRMGELQAIGRKILAQHDLGHNDPLIFFHGLGLEHNDLETDDDQERDLQHRQNWMLEKDMIAAVHVAYPGGVRDRYFIENIAVVGEDGGESLFDWGFGPLTNAS